MHFFNGYKSRQAERLSRDDDDKGERGSEGKCQSKIAESLASREQILDQTRGAQPEPEQDQSANGGPEHRAPPKTPTRRNDRRLNRHRQQRRLEFRRDLDRAARWAA